MLTRENVLQLIHDQGPLLPIQIKKHIGGDSLIIGAILSELLDTKDVLVSKTRFGSSPAYYTTGQEKGLSRLSLYLTSEQRKTLQILEQKKTLEDKKQTMESRIALRQLQDFCIPSSMKGKLFWKWHEISDEQAIKRAGKTRLKPKAKPRNTKKTRGLNKRKHKKFSGNKKSRALRKKRN